MSYVVVGLLQLAGVILFVLYAAQDDEYYGGGVTRWEHATRSGSPALLVALFGIAAGISVAFVFFGLRQRRPAGFIVPAIALYLVALTIAYAALSLGH